MEAHQTEADDEANTEHTCPECGSSDVWSELDNLDEATGDVHMMCEDCGAFFWADGEAEKTTEDDSDDGNDGNEDDWRTMSADECKRQNGLEQVDGVLWESGA